MPLLNGVQMRDAIGPQLIPHPLALSSFPSTLDGLIGRKFYSSRQCPTTCAGWAPVLGCTGSHYHNHLTVNHTVTFMDGDVHTNKIEGLWMHAKDNIPKTNHKLHTLNSYLAEFCYRRLR